MYDKKSYYPNPLLFRPKAFLISLMPLLVILLFAPRKSAIAHLTPLLTPASLSDGGSSTLSIDLGAGEQLSVLSNGTTYTFSLNGANTFSNGGVANTADFDAFGNSTITLQASGLTRYDTINITDSGAGASVVFNDSGSNAYSDAFNITLDNTAAMPGLTFNGASDFGASNLTADIDTNILMNSASSLTTVNGDITLNANQGVSATSGEFKGIHIEGATIESATGSITLNGRGGDASDFQYGIYIGSYTIIRSTGTGATAAPITLNGTGGDGTHSNYGVHITNINPQVTTIDGDLQITGQGGNGSQANNHGIYMNNGTVSTQNGNINLTGDGGDGTGTDFGIWLQGGGTQILSVDGDIQLTGTGGDGSGHSKDGLEVRSAVVKSTGTGNVTVIGNTGQVGQSVALRMYSGGTYQVNDGNLTLTGISNGSNGHGLHSPDGHSPSLVSTGAGEISITATGSGSGPDISFESNGDLGGASATGDITVNADTVKLGSNLNIHSTGHLTIQPRSASTTIGLGGGTGTLNLDDDELSAFQDGFASITIGHIATGTGTVDIDSATFLDDVIIAGGTIHDNAGTDITAPSVTLDGNVAPGQSPGQLVVNGDLTFTSAQTLTLELNGTIAGTDYDQVDVTGAVNLTDAVLTGTLGFTPTTGDDFIIINNDGADPVVGTFDGLAEGAMITIGDYEFTVTYVGGDGNDVVLLNATPLAVTLALFETEAESDSVLIRWQTVSEQDNLGFNLYRATEIDGEQSRLNGELISAQAPGSGQGAEYQWRDTNVEMGSSYFYWLEDVDVNGTTTLHGPISATVNQTTAVTIGELGMSERSTLPAVVSLMLMLLAGGWLLLRRQH